MTDCYFDSEGCLVCPAVPEVQASPARVEYDSIFGWDAGANSAQRLSAPNLRTRFGIGQAVGVVVGFATPPRADVGDPNNIAHGLHFYRASDVNLVQVVESGQQRGDPLERAADDEFEIRRVGGVVSYYRWQDDTRMLIYRSDVPSYGTLLVGTALYASGDRVL